MSGCQLGKERDYCSAEPVQVLVLQSTQDAGVEIFWWVIIQPITEKE